MSDAALPVTTRAVEQFTESYLSSIGAQIEKDGHRWSVTLTDDDRSDLDLDGAVLEVVDDAETVSEDAFAISPESPFVERLLDEAAERAPVGSLSLTGDDIDLRLPHWATAGEAEVVDSTFTPYYDRRALCVLFHIGIETVSEYQREELRATAIDLSDLEPLPRLADTYLDLAGSYRSGLNADGAFDEGETTDAIGVAREIVEDDLSSLVAETQQRATRAAEVELDEYEQFARQRREELSEEIDRLQGRIEDTTERIDATSDQGTRVEALQERKKLRAELDDLRTERDELVEKIRNNFPERRRQIRERHSITVRTRPVTTTLVSYERGDLRLTLREGDDETTTTCNYAVGTGVIDDPACGNCGERLSEANPATLEGDQLVGSGCCGQ